MIAARGLRLALDLGTMEGHSLERTTLLQQFVRLLIGVTFSVVLLLGFFAYSDSDLSFQMNEAGLRRSQIEVFFSQSRNVFEIRYFLETPFRLQEQMPEHYLDTGEIERFYQLAFPLALEKVRSPREFINLATFNLAEESKFESLRVDILFAELWRFLSLDPSEEDFFKLMKTSSFSTYYKNYKFLREAEYLDRVERLVLHSQTSHARAMEVATSFIVGPEAAPYGKVYLNYLRALYRQGHGFEVRLSSKEYSRLKEFLYLFVPTNWVTEHLSLNWRPIPKPFKAKRDYGDSEYVVSLEPLKNECNQAIVNSLEVIHNRYRGTYSH